jgi:hypothetical protein
MRDNFLDGSFHFLFRCSHTAKNTMDSRIFKAFALVHHEVDKTTQGVKKSMLMKVGILNEVH